MSEPRQPGVRLAEDRVSRKLVWGALAFAITGILVFGGFAWILHDRPDAAGPPPRAKQAPAALAEVRQTEILAERPGQRRIRLGQEALARWEWVDRGQGIVSMPIEDAMRLVVQEAAAPP